MLKRLFALALLIGVAIAFFPLMQGIEMQSTPIDVGGAYLSDAPGRLGGANVVTSVVVTYRGLDTLGEVTVLFAASAGVALAFSQTNHEPRSRTAGHPPSELIRTGASILLPLILLFGVFIFVHGHLTPGGGFQGGVVIASGVLLSMLAGTCKSLPHGLLGMLEVVAGAGYIAVGVLGLWLAAGFLDPRFLPAGEIGALFSAGAIPVIYCLVGVKVGAELSGVIDTMRASDQT